LRCSNKLAVLSGSLSKGTSSSRMEKSPVSFDIGGGAHDQPEGIIVEAEPISWFPRLVKGWYWW